MSQHLHNSTLGREETPEDYVPYALDCPATQSLAAGQDMWRTANKRGIEAFNKGDGPDPHMGLYWIAQGQGEQLPYQAPEPG